VRQDEDDGAAVAAAALDPLEDADASGTARVVERSDGTRVLEVELQAPDLDDAYYEVWLLKPDVSGLIPVGTTQAGTAQFEIPPGVDLGQYPVVDVSVEPLDGDPEHSGDSVVRGVLET
jgi:anti-sigma-K factor RskA